MISCWEEKGTSLLVSTSKMPSIFFILVSSLFTLVVVTTLSSSKSSLSFQKRSFGNVSTLGSLGLLHIAIAEENLLQHKDVEQMDTNDEAILFGEGGTISSKTPSAHKSSPSVSCAEGITPALNLLDHSNTNPLINKLHTLHNNVPSCPSLWS
eukprot:12285331-Ditylum_brightwellii.AAC.1